MGDTESGGRSSRRTWTQDEAMESRRGQAPPMLRRALASPRPCSAALRASAPPPASASLPPPASLPAAPSPPSPPAPPPAARTRQALPQAHRERCGHGHARCVMRDLDVADLLLEGVHPGVRSRELLGELLLRFLRVRQPLPQLLVPPTRLLHRPLRPPPLVVTPRHPSALSRLRARTQSVASTD
jgi:hypothetical protein